MYEDTTNASLENPMGARLCGLLSKGLEEAISKTGIQESEAPSMNLRLETRTKKRALGKGPYPELVEAFGKVLHDGNEHPMGWWATMKERVALTLCKLFCFVRIHGVEGFERNRREQRQGQRWH